MSRVQLQLCIIWFGFIANSFENQCLTVHLGDWLEKKNHSYNHKTTTIWVFH
jgi:hypothetical protein